MINIQLAHAALYSNHIDGYAMIIHVKEWFTTTDDSHEILATTPSTKDCEKENDRSQNSALAHLHWVYFGVCCLFDPE
jgi:hypothetical protein